MAMKTICVDFDGVIHRYDSGWTSACDIPDAPVPGAFDWLGGAVLRFKVCVYSSRSKEPGAIEAMQAWMRRHGMSEETLARLDWPTQKPAAFMTIDDRAICFEGNWSAVDMDLLDRFKPWNKREFPRGQVSSNDQGQLAMKIANDGRTVRLAFNKPTAWIGLGAEDAKSLAALLLKHAADIES